MVRPLAAFCLALMLFAGWAEIPAYAAMKGKTGIGMAEWAFRAYNEGWTYSYGGSSAGRVDCSGLIRSYCNGQGGGAKALLNASSVNGSTGEVFLIYSLPGLNQKSPLPNLVGRTGGDQARYQQRAASVISCSPRL